MNRSSWMSLIGITALTVVGLIWTFAAGNEPVLGIELQGGASVVLTPVDDPADGALDQAIEIIRQRVDGLGAPASPGPRVSDEQAAQHSTVEADVEVEVALHAPDVDDLALPDYDHLPAAHIVGKLSGLNSAELDAVEAYELAHRHRRTVLGKITQVREA